MSLEKILSTAFLVPMGNPHDANCRWGLNVMLWGDPGIGKSDRVEAAAMRVGLPCRTTYVPTCQPEDAAGTAFLNTSKPTAFFDSMVLSLEEEMVKGESPHDHVATKLYQHAKSNLFRKLVSGMADVVRRYGSSFARIEPLLPGVGELLVDGQGVWFLDELSSARPAVQGGFLGATLARRVGGLYLPPGVRIVAAGNPPESAAGGWELEPPMANRFCHFDVKTPSSDEWQEWLLNEGSFHLDYIEDGERRVRDAWQDHWPVVKGVVSGFLKTNSSLLFALPAEGHKDRGRAWPSPRTWTFAARALATARCLGVDDETTSLMIEGCIGEAAAQAFFTWVKNADLPMPIDVLNNGWPIDKKRLDRCVAVYTSMIAYVTGRQDKEEKKRLAIKAWERLSDSVNANLLDLTLPMAHSLVKAGLDTKASNEIAEAAQPVMVALAKAKMGQFLTGAK